MDKHNEQLDRLVKQTFGPTARLDGTIGSASCPGELRILLDEQILGRGGTFAAALQDAEHTAAAGCVLTNPETLAG